jgi:hypothetical protein
MGRYVAFDGLVNPIYLGITYLTNPRSDLPLSSREPSGGSLDPASGSPGLITSIGRQHGNGSYMHPVRIHAVDKFIGGGILARQKCISHRLDRCPPV